MAILEISRATFDSLPDIQSSRSLWVGELEVAWYADALDRLAGVLTESPSTGRWGYSICRLAASGKCTRVAFAGGIASLEEARDELLSRMRELA